MKITRDEDMRRYHIFIDDKDLRNAQQVKEVKQEMDYYQLSREGQWLGNDSPYNIGGRPTDVGQIALSLEHIVRNLYPVNAVPENIVSKLIQLKSICFEAEKQIGEFIEVVNGGIK